MKEINFSHVALKYPQLSDEVNKYLKRFQMVNNAMTFLSLNNFEATPEIVNNITSMVLRWSIHERVKTDILFYSNKTIGFFHIYLNITDRDNIKKFKQDMESNEDFTIKSTKNTTRFGSNRMYTSMKEIIVEMDINDDLIIPEKTLTILHDWFII